MRLTVVLQFWILSQTSPQIMTTSIKAIKDRFNTDHIKLSAQQYLIKFYESHGFKSEGEGYLEDGIPHIAMKK